jgi:hypothetical protein
MPQTKRKLITAIDNTLGLAVRVQVGGTEEQAHAACPKWTGCGIDGEPDDTNYGWTLFHNGRAFIWLETWPKTPDGIGCLIHELSHAVSQHCKYTGVQDEETFCYLMQYFTAAILTKLK